MRSFTDIIGIQNNQPADVGPATLGVRGLDPGPPPTARIVVMLSSGEEQEYVVGWGETFPIGPETWRFSDVQFENIADWMVVVSRVDPDSPPWQPPPLVGDRVWLPIQLRRYGQLDEGQLRALETALGRELPPTYRQWLAEHNGAQLVGDHTIPTWPFSLFEERPLLGVHPQYPPFDLLNAEQQVRRGWLSDDYVVIARPSGGLLAVKTSGSYADAVLFLPEAAMTGPGGPVDDRHLLIAGQHIHEFLGRLQPIVTPVGETRFVDRPAPSTAPTVPWGSYSAQPAAPGGEPGPAGLPTPPLPPSFRPAPPLTSPPPVPPAEKDQPR